MNNEETPAIPSVPSPPSQVHMPDSSEPTPTPMPVSTPTALTPEVPIYSQVDYKSGVWVAKAKYEAYKAETEKQRVLEARKNNRIRAFYILLSISGFLLFVLYIGMLVWPFQYVSRDNCSENFMTIAFWLNPLGYLALLTTGIVGVTIKHRITRPWGISFIAASPILWFITGAYIIFSSLCGGI